MNQYNKTHQLAQNQPLYAEGMVISHQMEPTLNQSIEHTKHRGGKMGVRNTLGEIVEVEGGHIVRSTGRKDRHSKVYTSKGPRDRRVRLSAHTAIEFYDVQDRLGFDRPSKAVDWLIKKAKASIDKLAELPPWHPIAETDQTPKAQDEEEQKAAGSVSMESCGYNLHLQRQLGEGENQGNHSAFISPHVDTDPIALFPTTSATSSSINFQSYPPDIISRTNNPTQDLGLSLHSFQDYPGLIPWQSQQAGANHAPSNEHQTLFSGSNPVGFENHYQRIVTWNNDVTTDHINKAGFLVNSQPFLGQGSASEYSQSGTGTLQSSFSPSVRSWNDISVASSEHHRSQQVVHQASIFGSRFFSDGLVGFCIPPDRIQGEQEDDRGVASNRPPSASPSSHH